MFTRFVHALQDCTRPRTTPLASPPAGACDDVCQHSLPRRLAQRSPPRRTGCAVTPRPPKLRNLKAKSLELPNPASLTSDPEALKP